MLLLIVSNMDYNKDIIQPYYQVHTGMLSISLGLQEDWTMLLQEPIIVSHSILQLLVHVPHHQEHL